MFMLENKPRQVSQLSVDYGDGQAETVGCLRNSCTWGRQFEVPGVFPLAVSLYGRQAVRRRGSHLTLHSVLVVQEPIKGLRIFGPSDVEIACGSSWTAVVEKGSHILFEWSFDGVPQKTSVHHKLVHGFMQPGQHHLQVKVFNDLGSAEATLTIMVKQPLLDVSLSVPPAALDHPTTFIVLLEGGPHVNVLCDFGDGNSATFLSNQSDISTPSQSVPHLSLEENSQVQSSSPTSSRKLSQGAPRKSMLSSVTSPPAVKSILTLTEEKAFNFKSRKRGSRLFRGLITHTYKAVGFYDVSVTVSNGVTEIRRYQSAVVEENIGDIRLVLNSSSAVAVDEEVVVTAIVGSGQDLKFSWNFTDKMPTIIASEDNISVARHKFVVSGTYPVSVTVFNELQPTGVRASLRQPITVIYPITWINLEPIPNVDGLFLTSAVALEASSDGSSVTFTFEYGDGKKVAVKGVDTMGFSSHYEKGILKLFGLEEGELPVQVTVTNALGEMKTIKKLFKVQVPPTNLKIEVKNSCLRLGQEAKIKASVDAGSNISYTWKLDDETELVNIGDNITHKYRKLGTETIQVTVRNNIGAITKTVEISVVEQIMGVTFEMEKQTVIRGEPVVHTARLFPASALLNSRFEWEFSGSKQKLTSFTGKLAYRYQQPGWHFVQVEAVNCLGRVASEALPVLVVTPVDRLEIAIIGQVTMSSPIRFEAMYWAGDSLSFIWDFGDGSSLMFTNSSMYGRLIGVRGSLDMVNRSNVLGRDQVEHIYKRVGEYTVTLVAENPVSRQTVTKKIFVLSLPCDAPDLKILGASSYSSKPSILGEDQMEILDSKPIRLESEIRVNCSTSNKVFFRWQILHGEKRTPVDIRIPWEDDVSRVKRYLRSPALALPVGALKAGRYLIKLKVQMNGTEISVYATSEMNLTVKASNPVSVVYGGIFRQAGQFGQIELDGKRSKIPGDPSASLSYVWSCEIKDVSGQQCFLNGGSQPLMNSSSLQFPSKWLSTKYSHFIFNLTVSASHTEPPVQIYSGAVSSQVIKLEPQSTVVDVFLECLQCWQNMVNTQSKISLRATSPGWQGDSTLKYFWDVTSLTGGDGEAQITDRAQSSCIEKDGQIKLPLKAQLGGGADSVAESGQAKSKGTTTTSLDKSTATVKVPIRSPVIKSIPKRLPKEMDMPLNLPFGEGQLPEPNEGTSRMRQPKEEGRLSIGFFDIAEGNTGTRRNIGSGATIDRPGAQNKGDVGKRCPPHRPDCLDQDRKDPSDPRHLIDQPRIEFRLKSEDTLTGLDQPSLVIKPGVLQQGLTYFVKVRAQSKDGSINGSAMVYFKVNTSPQKGTCSVRPDSGEAGTTVFSVFCKEWRDEHLPISYEVAYSTSTSPDRKVVYHGLRHNINFHLPQGPAQDNFKVLLHTTVLDSLGARTTICQVPIRVLPANNINAFHNLSPLNNETHAGRPVTSHLPRQLVPEDHNDAHIQEKKKPKHVDSMLQETAQTLYRFAEEATFDASSHDLLVLLNGLADRLNLQTQSSPCSSPSNAQGNVFSLQKEQKSGHRDGLASTRAGTCSARAKTRTRILKALEYIPIRDEVEIIQALQCLFTTTSEPSEVDEKALLAARWRLSEIKYIAQTFFSRQPAGGLWGGFKPRALRLVGGIVSNILTSLSINQHFFSGTDKRQDFFNITTANALRVLDSFLQMELQFHSLGERAASIDSDFVSVNASHFDLRKGPPSAISVNTMTFQLPQALGKSLMPPHRDVGKEKEGEIGETTLDTDSSILHKNVSDVGKEKPRRHQSVYNSSNTYCLQTRAVSFRRNPFAFMAKQPDMIQSEVASLDIYTCGGENLIAVHDLPDQDMVKIVMPRKNANSTKTTRSLYYLEKTAMHVHNLNTTPPHLRWLYPHHMNSRHSGHSRNHHRPRRTPYTDRNGYIGSRAFSDSFLFAHIRFDKVDEGTRSFPVMVVISSQQPPNNVKQYVFKQYYARHVDDIKIFLPSKSFKADKKYHIGLVDASFNKGRRRPNEVKGRDYTFNSWWGTCLFWNTSVNSWSSDGCHVMPSTSVDEMHCRCSHLTTFGNQFELISSTLSFTHVDEFFFNLHENLLVVIMVALVIVIYIVGVLVLSPADAEDTKKDGSSCVYLQDNSAAHHQTYEIALETGFSRHAATTSKISIILHGAEGVSETRELISEDKRIMFKCNSRDRFIVTFPESLGQISKIQLWHNNSGSSPGWYLRQAVVKDLNTGQATHFLCQRWFAVDREDGKVEREFIAVEGRHITFSMVFWLKGSQYLADFHTWMSVLTRPPHSRFTRIQRLTVCLTILSVYMCLSAFWFKDKSLKVYGEFGLLDLSWQNVTLGSLCCLVVIPLHLLLGFLFRRSRVHYPGYERDRALMNDMTKVGSSNDQTIGSEEQSGQNQMPSSILDQSILNWQNIQDWAQKQWLKRQQSVRSSANSVKTSQTSPQLSAPSTTPLVQTLLAEYDTDHGSSAWDATSHAAHGKKGHKDSSIGSSKNEASEVVNSSRRIFLPFWCRYVAWVLCFLVTSCSLTLTIVYGIRFGHTKCVMWIQCVYSSFMICVFITQPILIFFRVVHVALRHCKNPSVFNHYEDGFYGEKEISGVLTQQNSVLIGEDEELQKGVAARSRARYLRFAGPPQEKQLKSSRKKQVRQRRALLLIKHCGCFITLFVVLSTIGFGKDSTSSFFFNYAIRQALYEHDFDGLSFETLKSPLDWYDWSNLAILDGLYTQTKFSGEGKINASMEEDVYESKSSWMGYIMGQVQFRQLKVKQELCQQTPYFRDLKSSLHCKTPWHNQSSDQQVTMKNESDQHKQPWEYVEGTDIWISSIMGQEWYDGSGYIIKLDQNRDVAVKQLREMKQKNWISNETLAVITEFTIYNAPKNLFGSVTLVMEVNSKLGKPLTSAQVLSTQLFRYVTIFDNFILGCELLYLLMTLWMIYNEMQLGKKLGKTYFHFFWNYIQLLICTASFFFMLLYICRYALVSEAVETLRSTFYEEFVDLSVIGLCDQMLKELVATVLFCVIIKSMWILRYYQVFWRLETVYRRCKKELSLAASIYLGLIVAFACLATGLFGAVMSNMRCLWSSITLMSALTIRILDLPEDSIMGPMQKRVLAIVLVFSYTFCHGFILTYIVAVLTQKLKKTRKCRVLALKGPKLASFYWHTLLNFVGWKQEPSVEESDNELPAEFTMAEILYLVEELLFRMNAVLGTSGLPDKHHSLSDSDTMPNNGEDAVSSNGSIDQALMLAEDETFLPDAIGSLPRLEQRLQKIEDKLCTQEPYLAQLLQLDSIGANVLSEEKEKELRTYLEYEIFRQLQMQRQESALVDKCNAPYASFSPDHHPSTINPPELQHIEEAVTNLLLQGRSGTQPRSQTNDPLQSGKVGVNGKTQSFIPQQEPKVSQTVKESGKPRNQQSVDTDITKDQWKLRREQLMPQDSKEKITKAKSSKLKNDDCQITVSHTQNDSYSVTKVDPMSTPDKTCRFDVFFRPSKTPSSKSVAKEADPQNKSHISARHPRGLTVGGSGHSPSSGNASPQSSESDRGHRQMFSSSGQSGSEQYESQSANKKQGFHVKPDITNASSVQSQDSGILSSQASGGWVPKPRQFNFLPELINVAAAESSSGSEQEVTLSRNRANHGRRNLRKTKSRGKGKGCEGCIDSSIPLTAEFGSSGQSGGSDFDIIIHRVPSEEDVEDNFLTNKARV